MRVLSNWRSVKLWESALERDLHRRHSLRTHGLLIGSFTLLLMWGVSTLSMHAGLQSLALRYALTLGVGYVGYLLAIRLWARQVIERRSSDAWSDLVDLPTERPGTGTGTSLPEAPGRPGYGDGGGGVGGEFTGGGASGDFDDAGGATAAAGKLTRGAFEAVADVDDGSIVVMPVLAVFVLGVAIVFGAGSLALLYFGWDVLLTVAVEVAFSYVSARAAVRVAREGWLRAVVRLTWKPLLGALLCAVLLGAALDHWAPGVRSLPQAVRLMLQR